MRTILGNVEAAWECECAEDEALFDRLFASAAGQYWLCVWLPCVMYYRTYPPLLLRRAREGDDDALDRLLRLDESVVADPGILRRWHEIMHNGSGAERRRMLTAIAGRPKGRLDRKAMRLGLSGLISQFAIGFGCRVTAPEIKALFDAVERVRSGRIDTSLPESAEAYSKAVQRNRSWPSLPTGKS